MQIFSKCRWQKDLDTILDDPNADQDGSTISVTRFLTFLWKYIILVTVYVCTYLMGVELLQNSAYLWHTNSYSNHPGYDPNAGQDGYPIVEIKFLTFLGRVLIWDLQLSMQHK